MRRAFTLIELMVVVAILAILYAVLFPAFLAARGAVQAWVAGSAMKQLGTALNLYAQDSDDTAPLAMYSGPTGLVAWFGTQQPDKTFDTTTGILISYIHGKNNRDASFNGKPWLGDNSGFGYNWGYLGSDFNMMPSYIDFPNCKNAARMSEVSSPSDMIAFTASSYFSAPWLKGDSNYYDFGFIDPPKMWHGNPDVDFRHQGVKTVDLKAKKVTSTGMTPVVRLDGSTKMRHFHQVTDAQFAR